MFKKKVNFEEEGKFTYLIIVPRIWFKRVIERGHTKKYGYYLCSFQRSTITILHRLVIKHLLNHNRTTHMLQLFHHWRKKLLCHQILTVDNECTKWVTGCQSCNTSSQVTCPFTSVEREQSTSMEEHFKSTNIAGSTWSSALNDFQTLRTLLKCSPNFWL